MLNPCCCLSPRIGAFVIAILDLVLSVTYAWQVLAALYDGKGQKVEMVLEIAICVLLLTMALLLLLGTWRNAADKIRLWLILWIVFVILSVAFQVFNIYSHASTRMFASLPAFLIFLYEIWVVYAYLTELRCGPAGLTYCPTQITV